MGALWAETPRIGSFQYRWGRQCSESHCTQQQVSKKAPTSSPPPRLHDLAPPPLTVLGKAPGNRPKLLCSSPWCLAFLLDRVCSSPFPCVIHLKKPKVGGRGQGKTGGRCTLSLIMLSDYPKIRKWLKLCASMSSFLSSFLLSRASYFPVII